MSHPSDYGKMLSNRSPQEFLRIDLVWTSIHQWKIMIPRASVLLLCQYILWPPELCIYHQESSDDWYSSMVCTVMTDRSLCRS
jgi:hypothetical protein